MYPACRIVQPSRSIPHASYGTAKSLPRLNRRTSPQTVSALSKESHPKRIDWKSPETRAALNELKSKWENTLKEIAKNPDATIGDPFPDELLGKVQRTAKTKL